MPRSRGSEGRPRRYLDRVIAIVQPRRIVAVVCGILGLASLSLMWDSVMATAVIDVLTLLLAVVGAVVLLPYLASGKGGAEGRIPRLLAHAGTLLLAASLSLGVIFAIATTRTETLPWWIALPLVALAIVLAVVEARQVRDQPAASPTESSSSS